MTHCVWLISDVRLKIKSKKNHFDAFNLGPFLKKIQKQSYNHRILRYFYWYKNNPERSTNYKWPKNKINKMGKRLYLLEKTKRKFIL